jgi:hypothetical protein
MGDESSFNARMTANITTTSLMHRSNSNINGNHSMSI